MLTQNLPILKEMFQDKRYREFIFELDELLRTDPNYDARKLMRILEGTAKGEKIVRFGDRWVISSFVPPVPSRAFMTFIKGGVDKDSLYTDLAHARRSAPLSVHVCITSRCPFRCEHCGATYSPGRAELTKDEWIQVIHDLQGFGVACIVFSGGEPLVRDDMEEIISAVDDRSSTLLFTNGTSLTLERARALKEAGLFMLAVSIDSPIPEEQNRLRGNPNAFSYATEAVRNASEAGLYTLVSSVVYRKNLNKDNLHRIFRLAKEHGAHEVRIHQPIPRGELTDPKDAEQIFLTPEDRTRLYRIQIAANQTNNGIPKVSSFPYTESQCKFGCGAGLLHSYISSTGELWPCDFVPLSFGNVVTEDLKEVYGRMMRVAGIPRQTCIARAVGEKIRGRELPISGEECADLCTACQSQSFPRFFKDLQTP